MAEDKGNTGGDGEPWAATQLLVASGVCGILVNLAIYVFFAAEVMVLAVLPFALVVAGIILAYTGFARALPSPRPGLNGLGYALVRAFGPLVLFFGVMFVAGLFFPPILAH